MALTRLGCVDRLYIHILPQIFRNGLRIKKPTFNNRGYLIIETNVSNSLISDKLSIFFQQALKEILSLSAVELTFYCSANTLQVRGNLIGLNNWLMAKTYNELRKLSEIFEQNIAVKFETDFESLITFAHENIILCQNIALYIQENPFLFDQDRLIIHQLKTYEIQITQQMIDFESNPAADAIKWHAVFVALNQIFLQLQNKMQAKEDIHLALKKIGFILTKHLPEEILVSAIHPKTFRSRLKTNLPILKRQATSSSPSLIPSTSTLFFLAPPKLLVGNLLEDKQIDHDHCLYSLLF